MKLKFTGQFNAGNLKIYENNNRENPLYTVNVEVKDRQYFKVKVRNKDNSLISEVSYEKNPKSKFTVVGDYTISDFKTGEKIKVKTKRGEDLFIGENKEMYLKRSIRNRKMRLYKNDELIMKLKCKTLIKNWLKGKYTAEIFNEDYTSLCVCVIIVALNVVFDEHNSATFSV